VAQLIRSAKMKPALSLVLLLLVAGCASVGDSPKGTLQPFGAFFSSGSSGPLFILNLRSDSTFVLSAHGYGNAIPQAVEGRWSVEKDRVTLHPTPPMIGGPLMISRADSSTALVNAQIRFQQFESAGARSASVRGLRVEASGLLGHGEAIFPSPGCTQNQAPEPTRPRSGLAFSGFAEAVWLS